MGSIVRHYDYLPNHLQEQISLNLKPINFIKFTKIFNREIDADQYLRYNTKRIQNKYGGRTRVKEKNYDDHQEIWSLLNFSGKTGNTKYVNDLKEILIPNVYNLTYDPDKHVAFGAVEGGNVDLVKEMVTKIKLNRNNIYRREDINNIMILTGKFNQPEIFEYLIQNGVSDYNTYKHALSYAAKNGHLEMVKLIIEKTKNQLIKNDAIIAAVQNGHLDVLTFLLENTSLTDSPSLYNEVMEAAGKSGHLDILNLIIQKYAYDYLSLLENLDSNLVDQVVQMIYEFNPSYQSEELMEYAIQNPDRFSYDSYQLLIQNPGEKLNDLIQKAKEYNNQEALRVLNLLVNTNKKILKAIESGNMKVLKDLIRKYQGFDYNSAAELASSLGNLDALNFLLENTSKDQINYDQLLMKLVEMGQLEVIDSLIGNSGYLISSSTFENAIVAAAESDNPEAEEIIQKLSPLLSWSSSYYEPLKKNLKTFYQEDKIDQARLILSNLGQDRISLIYALDFKDYPLLNLLLKNLKSEDLDKYNNLLRDLIINHPFIVNEDDDDYDDDKENFKNFNSLLKSAKDILNKDDLNDILYSGVLYGKPKVIEKMIKLGADNFKFLLNSNIDFPDDKRYRYSKSYKLILDQLGYKPKDYNKLIQDFAKSGRMDIIKLLLTLGADGSSLFELLNIDQIDDLQKNNYID